MADRLKTTVPGTELSCAGCAAKITLRGKSAAKTNWSLAFTPALCSRCSPGLYAQCTPFEPIAPAGSRHWLNLDVCAPMPRADGTDVDEKLFAAVRALKAKAEEGNRAAIQTLVDLTFWAVIELESLSLHFPEQLRAIARKNFLWPVMASRKRMRQQLTQTALERLGVGSDAQFAGKFQYLAITTLVTLLLLAWLHRNHAVLRLPTLGADTSKVWFEVGWRRLLSWGGVSAHTNPLIVAMGKSAVGKTSTSRGMPEQTAAMCVDDVIAKAKDVLWSTFERMRQSKT